MIGQSLILKGCRRLLHKGTKEVHYTPHSKLQLILGMNGYGKTTLLEHFSPLPPSQKEFIKGGYKEFTAQHNNQSYVLTADFSKGAHYCFLVDGRELNDGHTMSVQKQLVEEHFHYTTDIHQVVMGRVKLTQLPTQKRKEWLVKFCPTDVSYAMGLYGRLSQTYRKFTSSKELMEKKLVTESSKLIRAEEFEAMTAEIKAIADEDQQIIANIGFVQWDDHKLSTLRQFENKITSLVGELTKITPPAYQYSSQEAFEKQKSMIEGEYEQRTYGLNQLTSQYETLSDAVSQLSQADGKSLPELELELTALNEALLPYPSKAQEDSALDTDAILADAYSIRDRLNHLLLTMPLNTDMELYNRTTIGAKRSELADLQALIDRAENRIANAKMRLEELKSHNVVECINCKHRWVPGMSEEEVVRLERLITHAEDEITSTTRRRDNVVEWLGYADGWVSHYKQYSELVQSTPRLHTFYDTLLDDKAIFNRPQSLVGKIDQYVDWMTSVREYKKLIARKDIVEHAVAQKQLLGSTNVTKLTQQLTELVSQIEQENYELGQLQTEVQKVRQYDKAMTDVVKLAEQINTSLVQYSELLIDQTKHQINEDLKGLLKQNYSKVNALNEKMTDARSGLSIVEHIRQTIDEMTLDIEAYEVLIEQLSPTSGIIADALGGFANALADQMNQIISWIWTTPLTLLPCAVVNGDLDYRFPIRSTEDTVDVSEGSEGEKEIVDFTFMMVARSYLGLLDFPLVMDEVGHSFHEHHKVSLYGYVKRLIESGHLNQVMVISHSPTAHATLVHADVNIMDPTGITVTPDANKHLKIV